MNTDPNEFTIVDLAGLIYAAVSVIIFIMVYFFLKRILRKLFAVWSQESLFGRDVKTRLISLGVVAILFPSVFFFVGMAFIRLIGSVYVDVPQALVRSWQSNQGFCQDYNLRACVVQLTFGFVQSWTSALSNALDYFGPGYISYSRLVLMLAVWAGVALSLSASSKEKDKAERTDPQTRLQNFVERLSPASKQNLMFFLILVLAGYLSIAAIAAIPGLEESAVPSEAVSVERLDQQLQETLAQSQARIPAQVQFSEAIATPTGAVPAATPVEGENVPASAMLNYQAYYLKIERDQWAGMYTKLLEDVREQSENLRASAISTYRASLLDRKGTRETNQHFLDIDAWYRQELNRMEGQLANCRRQILSVNSLLTNLSAQSGNDASWGSGISQVLQNADQETRDVCQSVAAAVSVPERKDLGSNMGPFSYVASWLLRTESLPLAQIVGLLGFGLLGSAVSSLVRSNKQRPRDQPLVDELATVIIRGATAAVVVFLAVKGGLAIFTSGDSSPNSYVLLLTCLVAAVFSEDVWAEAHNRLTKGLNGDDELPNGEPTPPAEPPAPVEPVTTEPLTIETPDADAAGGQPTVAG